MINTVLGRLRNSVLWIVLLGILITAAGFGVRWFALHAFTRPYTSTSLREQWTADGTLDTLREWARTRFAEGTITRKADGELRRLSPPFDRASAIIPRDPEKGVAAVLVEFGGNDKHHGLIIGGLSEQYNYSSWVRSQWRDDVWWYDGSPRTDKRSAINVK